MVVQLPQRLKSKKKYVEIMLILALALGPRITLFLWVLEQCAAWKGNFFFVVVVYSGLRKSIESNDPKWTNFYMGFWCKRSLEENEIKWLPEGCNIFSMWLCFPVWLIDLSLNLERFKNIVAKTPPQNKITWSVPMFKAIHWWYFTLQT